MVTAIIITTIRWEWR